MAFGVLFLLWCLIIEVKSSSTGGKSIRCRLRHYQQIYDSQQDISDCSDDGFTFDGSTEATLFQDEVLLSSNGANLKTGPFLNQQNQMISYQSKSNHQPGSKEPKLAARFFEWKPNKVAVGLLTDSSFNFTVNNVDDTYVPDVLYCLTPFSELPGYSNKCNLRSAWLACFNITSPTIYSNSQTDRCRILLPELTQLVMMVSNGPLEMVDTPISIELIGQETQIIASTEGQFYEAVNSSFISFYSPFSSSIELAPSLLVHNATIALFGDPYSINGAFNLEGNIYFTISFCNIEYNMSPLGAALYVSNNIASVHIHDSAVFKNLDANYEFGWENIYFTGNISNILIESSWIEADVMFKGSQLHSNITFHDVSFYLYRVLFAENTIGLVITNSTYFGIVSSSFIYFAQSIRDVVISNIIIEPLPGYPLLIYSPIIFIGAHSHNVTVYDVSAFCDQDSGNDNEGYNKESMIYVDGSYDVNIADVTITSCATSNALISVAQATNVKLTNICIDETLASSDVSIEFSTNVVIEDSYFANNYGSVGGAIRIEKGVVNVTIINSLFFANYGYLYGGAIYLDQDSKYVTIVGCSFIDNSAMAGGAIYLSEGNYQFVMIDSVGYKYTTILETPHPYIVPDVVDGRTPASGITIIYSKVIAVPDATEYILNFDFSEFQKGFTVAILNGAENVTAQNIGQYEVLNTFSYNNLPGQSTAPLRILSSAFTFVFYAPADFSVTVAYGIKAYVYPCIPGELTTPNILSSNNAYQGGGLMFYYGNQYSVLINVVINNNGAGIGGGIFYQNGNVGGTLLQVTITNNYANGNGGGLALQTGQFAMLIAKLVVRYNFAEDSGGGIYIGSNNGVESLDDETIFFDSTIVEYNEAFSNGGGMNVLQENRVTCVNSTWSNNIAYSGDGGGIYFGTDNQIQFNDEMITVNNIANRGGGIMTYKSTYIFCYTNCIFHNNHAIVVGGGIGLYGVSTISVQLGELIFRENSAGFGGGGMIICSAPLWMSTEEKVYFINNSADHGSALFVYDLSTYTPTKLINTTFENNHAYVGGTLFWVFDHGIEIDVNDSSNTWIDNVARYGNRTATQAVTMVLPEEYNVTVYGGYLNPPISATLYDFYNQRVISNDTSVSVQIIREYCTYFSFVSGPDIQEGGLLAMDGIADFNRTQASCSPGGWLLVNFTAQIGSMVSQSNKAAVSTTIVNALYLKRTTRFKFRECIAGEFETKGQCQLCPDDNFSLKPNQTKCESCKGMSGVADCGGNQLDLHKGYWRRYPTSSAVQSCPFGTISCLGGTMTGDDSCSFGYEGPLCAVCSSGFFHTNKQCLECTSSSQFMPATIGLIFTLATISLFALLTWRAFHKHQLQDGNDINGTTHNGDNEDNGLTGWHRFDNNLSNMLVLIYEWMRLKYKEMLVRLKIVISTYQVISATSNVFAITFPKSFTNFLNGIKFFNVNISGLLPIGCFRSADINFVSTLLWTSLTPIAASLLMLVAFAIEFAWTRHHIQQLKNREKGMKRKAFNHIKGKYLNLFFYLTYFVLPSVTTTLFEWFNCTNVDPNNEDNDQYDLFLTADMSISCQSAYYDRWTAYVICMILVYPVGIPAFYLYALYRHRQDITTRNDLKVTHNDNTIDVNSTTNPAETTTDQSKSNTIPASSSATTTVVLGATTLRLAFLWRAYEPKYWYWEIIETTRKLVLTALLSVIARGSSKQNVLGVLLSYSYIRLYGYFRPYEHARDNILAETGQLQILFTFFIALILQNSLLDNEWNDGLGVILILINIAIIFLLCYYEVGNYYATKREQLEKSDNPPLITDESDDEDSKMITVSNVLHKPFWFSSRNESNIDATKKSANINGDIELQSFSTENNSTSKLSTNI